MSGSPECPPSQPDPLAMAGPLTGPFPGADGHAATPPEHIGRFHIEGFVGAGAFGQDYRAYDPSLKRGVALKVARPEQLHSQDRIERFLREARAAAHLLHPHIVPVFDSGQDGPYLYIASAFIA